MMPLLKHYLRTRSVFTYIEIKECNIMFDRYRLNPNNGLLKIKINKVGKAVLAFLLIQG